MLHTVPSSIGCVDFQGKLFLDLRDAYGNRLAPESSELSVVLTGRTSNETVSAALGHYDLARNAYQVLYQPKSADDYDLDVQYGTGPALSRNLWFVVRWSKVPANGVFSRRCLSEAWASANDPYVQAFSRPCRWAVPSKQRDRHKGSTRTS